MCVGNCAAANILLAVLTAGFFALAAPRTAMSQSADAEASSKVTSRTLLTNAIEQAKTVTIVRFSTPCWNCRIRHLVPSSIEPFKAVFSLSESQKKKAARILSDPSSEDLTLKPPCAFMPDHGVSLSPGKKNNLLLVAPNCEAIRYVAKDEKTEAPLIYLKHNAFSTLEKILHDVPAKHGASQ